MAADYISTIATVNYQGAHGMSAQNHLQFNGSTLSYYYHPSATGASAKMVMKQADVLNGTFGSAITVSIDNSARSYQNATCSARNVWKTQQFWNFAGRAESRVHSDDSTNTAYVSSDVMATYNARVITELGTTGHAFPNMCTDRGDVPWFIDATVGYTDVVVGHGSTFQDWATVGGVATLASGLSGTAKMTQIVEQMGSSDMSAFFNDGAALYHCHYDAATTTWSAAEDVGASVQSYVHWCGATLPDGSAVAFWKDSATTTTIKCNVRSPGVSGTWGTPFDFETGAGASSEVAVTTNTGHASQAVVYFSDGTNFITRTLDNGSPSATTETQVTAHGGLITWRMSTLRFSKRDFAMVYHASGGALKLVKHTIAPIAMGVSGTLIGDADFWQLGAIAFEKSIASYGDYDFCIYNGMDGRTWGGVYNRVTQTWDIPVGRISSQRHWDAHNFAEVSISPLGYVTLAMGGRVYVVVGGGDAGTILVLKSNYPLGHASFSLSAFTAVGPTGGATYTGRGYKWVLQDSNEVIHLCAAKDNQLIILNNQSGSWTTAGPGTVFDVTGAVSGYNAVYIDRVLLGKETSGQQSLNIMIGYTDDAHYEGGGNYEWKAVFFKAIMQADGTYLLYDIEGTLITAPLTEAYTSGPAIVFDGSVETTRTTVIRQGLTILADNTPLISRRIHERGTFAYVETRIYQYNTTTHAWEYVALNKPTSNNDCETFEKPNGDFVLNSVVNGNLVQNISTNRGATWGDDIGRTAETVSISGISVAATNVAYTLPTSPVGGETRMVPLLEPVPFQPIWALQANQSMGVAR